MKTQTVKVVMLPTDDISDIAKFESLEYDKVGFDPTIVDTQHLYLVSDEKVNIGDWDYNPNGTPKIQKQTNEVTQDVRDYGWRKIIASTDPSLGLPIIPQNFIQQYVEAQGKIEEVRVEIDYETEVSIYPSNMVSEFEEQENSNTYGLYEGYICENCQRPGEGCICH